MLAGQYDGGGSFTEGPSSLVWQADPKISHHKVVLTVHYLVHLLPTLDGHLCH